MLFFLNYLKKKSFSQRSFFPMLCEVCPDITSWGCRSSAMNRPLLRPAGRPGASLLHPGTAVRWETSWGRHKGWQKRKNVTLASDRGQITGVQCSNTNKQWGKPHVTTHMRWLICWDTAQKPSFDVTQSRHTDYMETFQDVNALSYRSSASPPIQTGLFSLESRL